MEKLERMAVGDRPRWLVEIDRFYRTQLGGADPIQQWLTIPLMYFESPQACVRRFWKGFNRLIAESPGQRIIAATHSGPIRAFATWAHGYDPGEPVNTEEVVVRIKQGGRTATVSYRNRVTEVNVPPVDEIPQVGRMSRPRPAPPSSAPATSAPTCWPSSSAATSIEVAVRRRRGRVRRAPAGSVDGHRGIGRGRGLAALPRPSCRRSSSTPRPPRRTARPRRGSRRPASSPSTSRRRPSDRWSARR